MLSVDLVSENWNQLHVWVFEASEAILDKKENRHARKDERGAILASRRGGLRGNERRLFLRST